MFFPGYNKIMTYLRQSLTKHVIAFLLFTNVLLYVVDLKNKGVTHIILYNFNYSTLSCYDEDSGNGLPLMDGGVIPKAKSIYFLETSCKGDLDSRQACSVESAARAHPEWQVYILFLGPVNEISLNRGVLKHLSKFKNIIFKRLLIKEFANGTLLESMLAQNIFKQNNGKSAHQAADVLRYLTLFKYGGIYLDLDVIVVRSLESLGRNWAVRQDESSVGAGIMSLSRDSIGKNVSRIALREVQKFYAPAWSYNSVGVITRALQQICSTDLVLLMTADTCQGFQVYPPKNFYPIHYSSWESFFKPRDMSVMPMDMYTYHMWNYLNQFKKIPRDSHYSSIAKLYCPDVFELYGDSFGL